MHTTTPDTLGAIVANDRDRRALAWLREKAGDAAIREAAQSLPGQRRPYLSNIARALGLELPAVLSLPPAGSAVRAEVARRVEALRARSLASTSPAPADSPARRELAEKLAGRVEAGRVG